MGWKELSQEKINFPWAPTSAPQRTKQFLLRSAQCWVEMKVKGRLQRELARFSPRLLAAHRVEGQRVEMLTGSYSNKCAHLLARESHNNSRLVYGHLPFIDGEANLPGLMVLSKPLSWDLNPGSLLLSPSSQ